MESFDPLEFGEREALVHGLQLIHIESEVALGDSHEDVEYGRVGVFGKELGEDDLLDYAFGMGDAEPGGGELLDGRGGLRDGRRLLGGAGRVLLRGREQLDRAGRARRVARRAAVRAITLAERADPRLGRRRAAPDHGQLGERDREGGGL